MTISGTYCGCGIGRQAGTQPKAGSPRRLRNPSRGSFHVHADASRAGRFDPTRTTTIRDRFARMIVSRLNEFARLVRISVEDNDCLGLTATPIAKGLVPKALEFNPDQPRDEIGRWTSGGASGGSSSKEISPTGKGWARGPNGVIEVPTVYIRFGNLPEGTSYSPPDIDPVSGVVGREAGVSVYHAYHDPVTDKFLLLDAEQNLDSLGELEGRPAFIVSGKHTGWNGADNEPLLEAGSVSVVSPVSLDKLVAADVPDVTLDGEELEEPVLVREEKETRHNSLRALQQKPAMRNQFNFATSDEKLREFGRWMKRMAKSKVLGVESIDKANPRKDDPWFGQVITSAYKKGIARAYDEMNKRRVTTGIDPKNPRQIDAALTTPVHAERVALIYSRVYNELDGVTDAMATQMSRTLAEGLAEGLGPRQIARNLLDTVDGDLELVDRAGRTIPAKRRAVMIARTEVIRAHHKGMIGTYESAGIEGVEVKAEWLTAGDDRVCEDCKDMEGRVFTLARAEGLIPLHPQCRCVALPKVEGFGAEDFEMEDVEEAM